MAFFQQIGNFAQDRADEFAGTAENAANEVNNFTQDRANELADTAENSANEVNNFTQQRAIELADTVESATNEIKNSIENIVNDIDNVLENTLPQIINEVKWQKNNLETLINQIKLGLEILTKDETLDNFLNQLKNILIAIKELIKFNDNIDNNFKNQYFDTLLELIEKRSVSEEQLKNLGISLLCVVLKQIMTTFGIPVPNFQHYLEQNKTQELGCTMQQQIDIIQERLQKLEQDKQN